ncbi:MAG: ComEC/Rec2 family competence protein [Allosphingosinicella sp.]|uniref:ComEC/Rec2 family competence protein n=1 Tax=Allosphingosinicella sp. TaxID=2823234 RepID=UPI00392425BD
MVRFEAVNAKYGDALLLRFEENGEERLWVIDGGPRGVWKNWLSKRLAELRKGTEKLHIDLMMVSHVDDDHIAGVLDMMRRLAGGDALKDWLEVDAFWHNSFADMTGDGADPAGVVAALAGPLHGAAASIASFNGDSGPDAAAITMDSYRSTAVLASIGQGVELRDYLTRLVLDGNPGFGGFIRTGMTADPNGVLVKVVGPIASRVEAFRAEWNAKTGNPAALASLFRDDLDESPTNLSSIVLLVEVGGKRILLTGDARGDDIVAGLEEIGETLPMEIDILKMPHHGSDRNITRKFLESVKAKHYVISADGHHGNPDPDTVRAIIDVRGDDDYTIHLTNDVNGLSAMLEGLTAGTRIEYRFRMDDALSIEIVP